MISYNVFIPTFVFAKPVVDQSISNGHQQAHLDHTTARDTGSSIPIQRERKD